MTFGVTAGRRVLCQGSRHGSLPRRGHRVWIGASCGKGSRSRTLIPSTRLWFSTAQIPGSEPPRKRSRVRPTLAVLGGLLIGAYYLSSPSSSTNQTLNDKTFIPYTITAREAISKSSFIITISPRHPDPSPPYLQTGATAWRFPLWSVEFKQPQVQISRHYTPLPLLPSDDPSDGSLRFYIRGIDDGEMSNYLSRLSTGQDVWLRGPHVGFDILRRTDGEGNLVFLAGGTGVAPGMQAAKAILDSSTESRVSLLWAVRKREELQSIQRVETSWWSSWSKPQPTDIVNDMEGLSPVGRQLQAMKTHYGDRLQIRMVVDEENTRWKDSDLRDALTSLRTKPPSSTSRNCYLHDQKLHEAVSEFESASPACSCSPSDGQLAKGKDLLIVSGPDGFVSHFAGPKVWSGGRQTQGAVGGIIGHLEQQNPEMANNWLVLKL